MQTLIESFLLYLALFKAESLYDAFRTARLHDAMNAELSSTECIACDSQHVESIGPDVYRCVVCGYEGGAGYGAFMERKRAARYATHIPRSNAGTRR